MRRLLTVLPILVLALGHAAPAPAEVPPGAVWTEEYFKTKDGVTLHADVLRPKGLPKDAKTPVILTVSPYTSHGGENTPNPTGPNRPSNRFHDMLAGTKLFERGFTYVMVDLRGFGGSAGCNDWGGPGEQEDVRAAVEWAASQPWSTGKVGLFGKSYDGWTGLMGLVAKPKGLAAVIALEPVYDGYRYLYTNGVRFETSYTTPVLFSAVDAMPGQIQQDTTQYHLNGTAANGGCYLLNIAQQQLDDPTAAFWKARELVSRAQNTDIPLFLTQGFLEDNTKPDAAWDFFNAVKGPKRGWFGMWDHVRPWEDMGRAPVIGFDQVAKFFDHYVRDVPLVDAPVDKDPPVEVQTNDGTWRGEEAWPPIDSRELTTILKPGTYSDDAQNNGSGSGSGQGLWTISPPLPHRAHLSGVPRLTADVTTMAPNANLTADLYDIDKSGNAMIVSRGTQLLRAGGRVSFDLYGDDWRFEPEHRIGVLITSSNAEWWTHVPTFADVAVNSARIALPFLQYERVSDRPGKAAGRLNAFKAAAPFALPASTITNGLTDAFTLPPALLPKPVAASGAAKVSDKPRLVARIAARGRRVVVFGTAPTGSRVSVALRRGKRTVATRRATAKVGAFRITIRVKRAGNYRAAVSTKAGGRRLSARTPVKRVR